MHGSKIPDDCGPILPPAAIRLVEQLFRRSPGQKSDDTLKELQQEVATRIVECGEWEAISHYRMEEFDTDEYWQAHRVIVAAFGTAKDRVWRPHRIKNPLAGANAADPSQPKKITPQMKPLSRDESARPVCPDTLTTDLKIDCQTLLGRCSPLEVQIAEMLMRDCSNASICRKLEINGYQLQQSVQRLRVKLATLVETRAQAGPT